MSNVQLGYTQVIDPISFKSIPSGKIYIGEYGTLPNPANAGTWKQAYFVNSDGTRTAASQPIATNAAGYAVDGSGNIKSVQVDGQYSILVQSSLGVTKFSSAKVAPLVSAEQVDIGNGLTQADINAQFVSPEEFYSGSGDWLSAIDAALAASKYVQFETGKTYACNGLPAFNGHVVKAVDVIIDVPAGTYTYSSGRYLCGVVGSGLKVKAPSVTTYTATAASFSGSAKAYDVTFDVPSSSGVSVGDYTLVRLAAGTGYFQWIYGVWKVTATTGTSITVRNTCHHASPPALTGVTSVTIRRLPVQFKFTGCNGFELHGAQLYLDGGMALVGDWDVAAATGTQGAHAVVVSAPNIIGGASSNAPVVGLGGITTGVDVAIYGWGEQGIAAEQGSAMSINFLASCANRKRGVYVSTNVGARGKFTITSGNGEDGVICDEGGAGAFSLGVSCGNGLNGYWATNMGFLNAASTYAVANLTNGYESRGNSRIGCDSATAANNAAKGVLATDGGMIDADSSTADGNASDGFYASNGSFIDANNASSKNNGGWGVNGEFADVNFAGSGTFTGNTSGTFNTSAIGIRGFTNSAKFLFLYNQTIGATAGANLRAGFDTTKFVDFVSTSVGDLVIKNNGTNSYIIKAQGEIYPVVDNTQDYGRAANRGRTAYFGTGTINTSDGREKTKPLPTDDTVLDAWGDVQFVTFQWLDAIRLKGEGVARWHFGVIAQQVRDAFAAHGLDGTRYGLLCYDEWEDQFDDDGNLTLAAGNRWGIRADQCLFIEAAYQRRRSDRVEQRLIALENK